MFRSKEEKNQMRGRIYLTLTVFLTILLFLGIPMSNATINPIIITNNSIKSNQIINSNSLLQVNVTLPPRPILSIEKTVNATNVQPNIDWIRINVTIKNIGNRTAYNLTVRDPSFSSWAVSTLNITEQDFVQIDINATVFYFYFIQTTVEGNFTLESTEITYFNETGPEYNARSQRFNIISIQIINIPPIRSELWVKILYYSLGITGGLGVIVLVDYAILKQVFQKLRNRQKRPIKKAPVVQQKSKRQMKRKVQKRRK